MRREIHRMVFTYCFCVGLFEMARSIFSPEGRSVIPKPKGLRMMPRRDGARGFPPASSFY